MLETRAYIAARALQGLLSNSEWSFSDDWTHDLDANGKRKYQENGKPIGTFTESAEQKYAAEAVEMADALIEALGKKKQDPGE